MLVIFSLAILLSGCSITKGQDNPPTQTQNTSQSEIKSNLSLTQVQITKIVDGDTLDVILKGTTERVRLIGVDTPETVKPNHPVEPYGREASNFTKKELSNKTVFLELDAGERDRYGRLLAYIWLEEPIEITDGEIRNKLFNAHLLLNGYAQLLTIPPNVKYVDQFTLYQREAREAKRGLWGLSGQQEPQQNKETEAGPKGETIKGNINSRGEKIYHVPGGQYYEQTNPEAWFFTEEEAQTAGFRASKK
ncbi:hypothetical protein N752_09715 [Desulforamulus aquiferis]|nr:thermonuclease family protein [Desulforamulus aquiferis]RYD05364.1 hypothetical protein N752_09715 [Desulforamulus aquiferis]